MRTTPIRWRRCGLATLAGLAAAAPFALCALLAGAAAVLLQTGFLINPAGAATRPRPARRPLAGLRALFGPATLIETGKAVLKAVAAGLALLPCCCTARCRSCAARRSGPRRPCSTTPPGCCCSMLLAVLAVQAVVALLDVVRAALQARRSDLRMSREDIRQEMRESEGDPQVKGRLRQLRLQRARQRMMAAVPKATVVVTNPTHYAVALAYNRAAGGAPRVVAKGVDAVAARIRAVAEENKVPLVANPPLARAL